MLKLVEIRVQTGFLNWFPLHFDTSYLNIFMWVFLEEISLGSGTILSINPKQFFILGVKEKKKGIISHEIFSHIILKLRWDGKIIEGVVFK